MTPRFRLATEALALAPGDVVRRVALRVMVGALVSAVAVAISSEASLTSQLPIFWTTVACLIASALAGLIALLAGFAGGRARSGAIEVGTDTLVVRRGEWVTRYRLDDLRQGAFREPEGLVLKLRSGLELRARATRADAEALLDLVGLSATQRVLRVPLASVASQRRGGVAMGTLGMILVVPTAFLATVLLGAFVVFLMKAGMNPDLFHVGRPGMWLRLVATVSISLVVAVVDAFAFRALAAFLGRREAVIGADGVAIEARGRRTFVSYAEMARVIRAAHGAIIELHGGWQLYLPVQGKNRPPLPAGPDAEPSAAGAREALHRRELLLGRIQDAASTAAAVSAAPIDVLDRKERSIAAWRDALRAALDRTGSYRGAHLSPEQLLDVVADVRAPPERRIAAAVALSATDEEAHKRRIRVAAEACADDDLRTAIEHAAEGEIAEAALDRIYLRHPTRPFTAGSS